VAPWIAWEAAVADLVMEIDFTILKKWKIDTDMPQGQLNLYSLESAHYFMMWQEWNPWNHYHSEINLENVHVDLLKKHYSKVSYILFFLIMLSYNFCNR
jgi:hypothetical protein